MTISIHALRKESDEFRHPLFFLSYIFQSTLSVRRATPYMPLNCPLTVISIHALRKESDDVPAIFSQAICNFNPRSP